MIIAHISFSLHRQSSTLNGTAALHQSSILSSSSITPSNPAVAVSSSQSQSQSTTWPQDISFLSFLAFAPVQVSLSTIFDLHSQVLSASSSSSSLPSTTVSSDTQMNHHYHHIMNPLLAMELVKDLLSATEHLIHW